MNRASSTANRLLNSAVVWSWAFNTLRLAQAVFLFPLLVKLLSKPDFAMHWGSLVSLAALVPILDFGFSVSIGRAVSYAMGGATELKAEGFVPAEGASGPNYALLWRLVHTTRTLYRFLSLGAFVLLGLFGTCMVALHVQETTSPRVTWLAWGITLLAAVWELYAGWWNVFLRSMNKVLLSTRQASLAYGVRLVISAALLLGGAGLLSVPIASFLSSFLQRELSRRSVLQLLGPPPGAGERGDVWSLFATLWPNSWKLGLQFLSGYLSTFANTFICQAVLSLGASGAYGVSLQLVSISASMAQVWTAVKWPLVGQDRTRQDDSGLQRLLWPRVWLQSLTHLALLLGVVAVVPWLLQWSGTGKTVLPMPWLGLLALASLLEMNYSFWGTLISTENRMPFVWPIIITNLGSFCLVLLLVNFTRLGLPAMVIAPLLAGSVLNYWRWPMEGARSIQTTWLHFILSRPR